MKEGQDNIEQFFIKRLSNKTFEFEEEQWAALSRKMDEEEAAGTLVYGNPWMSKRVVMVLIVIFIAIIAFLSGWFLNSNGAKTKYGASINKEIPLTEVDAYATQMVCEEDEIFDEEECIVANETDYDSSRVNSSRVVPLSNVVNAKNRAISEQISKQKYNTLEDSKTDLSKADPKKRISSNQKTIDVRQEAETYGQNDNESKQTTVSAKLAQKSGDPLLENKHVTNVDDLNNHSTHSSGSNNSSSMLNYLSHLLVGWPELEIPFPLLVVMESVPVEEDTEETSYSKWSLTLFVAPDFNSTSFTDLYNSLGQAIGIRLAYYMMQEKLKIDLGGTLNNKIYTAKEGDYTPIPGFWVGGIAPVETDAKCLILDIPVNIGYRLLKKNKQALWVNTGISSYWMLTENYQYQYDVPNPEGRQQWTGERENFHLAGTWNLSVTYEYELTKNLSMILEPYYKSPLTGIGHGSVELISSGINVGLKYKH